MLTKFKRWLSGLVLRGGVLQWWLRGKMRKLHARYFQLVRESAARGPVPEARRPRVPAASLRAMLFITDDQWEEAELVPELRRICEVRTLNLRQPLKRRPDDLDEARVVAREIEAFIAQHPGVDPGLIFLYARSPMLSDEVFDRLRGRWSCPLLGMNLDDKIELWDYGVFTYRRDNYLRWAARFDLNLTNGKLAEDWYRDRNLPVYYMAQGCHQKVPLPPATPQFEHDITFLGRWRPERAVLIERLRALGVPVRPFGGGWPGSGEVDLPERIYQASQINLGSGYASPSDLVTTTKGRDFECPAAGACYLTSFNWELTEHFEIGREMLCYRSIEEAAEIYSYYHRRPEECLKIAHAAYRRCAADHTWEKRFRALFATLGFNCESRSR